jgi:Tol biopolymer transport system component
VRLTNHSAPSEQVAKAWSPDGTRLAYASNHTGDNEIWVVNADGTGATNLTNRPGGGDGHPSWSPDGSKIAYQFGQDGLQTISVMNADGSGVTQLTQNGDDRGPEWSPDGTKITWVRDDGVYVMNPDGSGQTLLVAGGWDPEWSPDGTRMAYSYNDHLYVMNADGSNANRLTTHPDRSDGNSKWSPDGTQITFLGFTMSDGFRRETYLINADGTGLTQLNGLPEQSGSWPRDPVWSPDGEWICGWAWNDGLGVIHPASGAHFGITPAGAKYWHPAWRPGG